MTATRRGVRDYNFWINGKLYDEIESLVEAEVKAGNSRANVKAFMTEAALRLVYLRKDKAFSDYRDGDKEVHSLVLLIVSIQIRYFDISMSGFMEVRYFFRRTHDDFSFQTSCQA